MTATSRRVGCRDRSDWTPGDPSHNAAAAIGTSLSSASLDASRKESADHGRLEPCLRIARRLVLGLGLVLGWGLARIRPAPLRAAGGDRSGESIVATGPVMVRYDEGIKIQIPQDALYYLDYKGGRLLATVPSIHQTVGRDSHCSARSPSATWSPTSSSTWTTARSPTS